MIMPQGSIGQAPSSIPVKIGARVRLAKGKLSLMLGFSSMLGFLLASPQAPPVLLLLVGGVVLLAGGAASLNSLQEWRQDRLMRRTMFRPLPQGELNPGQALRQAVLLIGCGLLLLSFVPGPLPVALGLLAVVLYNGVYTPLKAKTMLALVPGAVCGSLPVVIGWIAGGGQAGSPVLGALISLLVLWQVPHSWLVSLIYRDDVARSRMPQLLHHLSEPAMRRLLVPWVSALAATMMLFTLLPLGLNATARTVLLCAAILLALVFLLQVFLHYSLNYRTLFIFLNLIFILFILIVCAARISLPSVAGHPLGNIV
ncbi:MAG: UbiA family prenyltransferase [Desulfoprunum sp.]|jgi:protoheme IX farnesyltransferase|uniref:UbiA family prenyltransferase n=1 Tax=Desulfoprunum sp. TaxID=2020866 RepID=UPI00068BBFC6